MLRLIFLTLAVTLSAGCGAQAHRAAGQAATRSCIGAGARTPALHVGAGSAGEAAIVGTGARGIVLANQSDRDFCAWRPFARELAAAGFRVLVFNYWSADPQSDVAAAVRALRRDGAKAIGLVGASEGARAVLVAAALRGVAPNAVVSLSAENGGRTGPVILPFLSRLHAPTLFVTARNDPWTADADETRQQYGLAASAVKRLEVVPGDAHGIDLLRGQSGRKLVTRIIDFVDRFV